MSSRARLRLRLTLAYAAVFFVGGVMLATAAMLLARRNVGPVRALVTEPGAVATSAFLPQRNQTEHAWRRTAEELATRTNCRPSRRRGSKDEIMVGAGRLRTDAS
jgi:hypothetical protein